MKAGCLRGVFYGMEEDMAKLAGRVLAAVVILVFGLGRSAGAHFGMVIPSDNMVMQADDRTIALNLSFSHPMEMVGMPLVKPKAFTVQANGEEQDLIPVLQPTQVMDHPAWKAAYPIKRPGVYMFVMEPQPYWEPAEDCYIIHYTKTVVTAFGDDEGWDLALQRDGRIVVAGSATVGGYVQAVVFRLSSTGSLEAAAADGSVTDGRSACVATGNGMLRVKHEPLFSMLVACKSPPMVLA